MLSSHATTNVFSRSFCQQTNGVFLTKPKKFIDASIEEACFQEMSFDSSPLWMCVRCALLILSESHKPVVCPMPTKEPNRNRSIRISDLKHQFSDSLCTCTIQISPKDRIIPQQPSIVRTTPTSATLYFLLGLKAPDPHLVLSHLRLPFKMLVLFQSCSVVLL